MQSELDLVIAVEVKMVCDYPLKKISYVSSATMHT